MSGGRTDCCAGVGLPLLCEGLMTPYRGNFTLNRLSYLTTCLVCGLLTTYAGECPFAISQACC